MNDRARTGSPLRILAWLIGALLVAVLVVAGAVLLFLPSERIRTLVGSRISSVVARDVRYTGASLGFWPPVRITVHQAELAEPHGFVNGTAFQAGAVHLDLDLLKLLTRRIVVRRLVLERPQLHLVLRPDGTTNFDSLLKSQPPGEGGQGMDLNVRELVIQDGRGLVDDLKSGRRTAFGLQSRISLEAKGNGERFATAGETVLSGLAQGPMSAVRLADLKPVLGGLDWRLTHDGAYDRKQNRLALARLTVHMGRTALNLSGVVDDPGPKARLDLRAKGSGVDLAQVLGFLAASDARALAGVSGRGRLDFDLGIHGNLGARAVPDLNGTLSVSDATLHYPGTPADVQALTMQARFAPDTVTIGDARARVAGQPVRAALVATHLVDPWLRFAVQGNLDLAAIGPLVAPKDTKMAGRAAVNVQGAGPAKDPGAMSLAGTARLAGVSYEAPDLPHKVEGIKGDLQFSQAQASVRGLEAHAGKSSIALDGTVQRPLALMAQTPAERAKVPPAVLSFRGASPYFDVADFVSPTQTKPVLPNATGGGEIRIGHLKNQKLDVSNVYAKIALSPTVMEVPQFSLAGYRGTVQGSGRFDLSNPAKLGYAVKVQADKIDANDILSAWTPIKRLFHGTLGANFSLAGDGITRDDLMRTLTAAGLAAMADGTLEPIPALVAISQFVKMPSLQQVKFKDGKFPFRVERGRVATGPATLSGPDGDWKVAGSVGFDGSLDYAVSGTLPPDVAARLGAQSALAAGALTDDKGRLFVDLRVTGNAKAPQVAWDANAMRDRVAGKVSQTIEAQKQKIEDQVRSAAEARAGAAGDSARTVVERAKRAAADSVQNRLGNVLKGFFGGRDTTRHP